MAQQMERLILASSSPYRRKLLQRLNIDFKSIASEIDETRLQNETPQDLVERLSISKAQHIAEKYTNTWIIGSDQVALLDNQILGKPGNQSKAFEQLELCSGKEVIFITGVCLMNKAENKTLYENSKVKVKFRQLQDDEINNYITIDKPFNCAGSFKVESLGVALFESVKSDDPTSLEGLPLILLCQLLRQVGFKLLN
jgi:MAF protein